MTAESLVRDLRRRLGPRVALALRPIGADGPGGPAEAEAVARAIPTRRAEFFSGRAAARAALEELGLPPVEIAKGADRAPVWPAGLVGSISHDAGQAVAAVARAADLGGIGVDLARGGPLDPDLWPTILTEGERDGEGDGHAARARFAAKEALFKALYPSVGRVFGFHAAEIALDGPLFEARLTGDLGPWRSGAIFDGVVLGRGSDLLLAAVALPK